MSSEEHREAADRATYQLIAERRAEVGLTEEPLQVAPSDDVLRLRLLGGTGEQEVRGLELVECLLIGAENSRDWQSRREALYLASLDLMLERWRFGWRPTSTGGAALAGDGNESQTFAGSLGLGLTRLFGTGAQVIGNIGLSLFDSLITTDGSSLTSSFSLNITQPLLQSFGRRITLEPLTQAERDLLYELRTYERFRRTFAVDVATRYWRILQQRDALANALANQATLTQIVRRNEALAKASRVSDIQLDQAKQDLLNADSGVISATQNLQSGLDSFKLFLGLPIEVELDLAEDALVLLDDDKLYGDIDIDVDLAVELAVARRLDLANSFDFVVDAERRAYIAGDRLRNIVDVVATGGGVSDDDQPFDFSGGNLDWSLGLDLDLAINRIPERAAYRSALITVAATRRSAEQFEDSVRVSVRDLLRDLQNRSADLEIQERSVVLAVRRVESTQRNLEAARAATRDLLEAQDALLRAQNSRTRALIDFRLAQFRLLRDTETLRVNADGLSREPFDADAIPFYGNLQ